MTQHEKVARIARVLVKRLRMERMEAIHVAYLILEALELPSLLQEIKGDKRDE